MRLGTKNLALLKLTQLKLNPTFIGNMGAVRRMRTRIRLLAQPEPMRSIIDATQ